MVNWTYIWTNYDTIQPEVKDDLGYARYPQSTQGEASRPPYGGIGVGVSEYSRHKDEAMQAIECITSPENQGVNAELTGNMPASSAGYQYPALAKIYPPAAARPVPAEPRRRGSTHGHAVLERHLRRPPELVAPAGRSRRPDPAGLATVHRGRPARKEPSVSAVSTTAKASGRSRRRARSAATGRAPRTGSANGWWHRPSS